MPASKFDVSTVAVRQDVYSPNYGAGLIVWRTSFGNVPIEDALDGTAKPVEAWLSADGRHYVAEWHEGPEADAVYVERHDVTGCTFHGWVDSVSRRIVQTG